MDNLKLKQSEIKLTNGEKVRIVYNKTDDLLDLFFLENKPATGVELTDNIL